jgi:hypothetical protein
MKWSNYLPLLLIHKCLTDDLPISKDIRESTYDFVNHLIDITEATCEGDCDYDNDTYDFIYHNSFQIHNIFNGYNRCNADNSKQYLYFLFIDPDNPEAYKIRFEEFFKNLIFYYYKSFTMCLPNNIHFKDNITVSYPDESSTYLLRVINLKEHNTDEITRPFSISFYIIVAICVLFSLLSIFFAIFPKSNIICRCRKNVRTSDTRITNMSNSEESGDPNSNEESGKGLYKILSRTFSLTRNLKRMFKSTANKTRLSSSYINDNSISFVNGMRGLSLFCFIFSVVFWILLVTPTSPINIDDLKTVFHKPLVLPVLYYIYMSLYSSFAINSFVLSYKFLYHTCNDSKFKANTPKFYKIITFMLPQTYKYLLYLFLLYYVYNLNDILYILGTKTRGPFVYMYHAMTSQSMENNINYIFPIANLMIEEAKGGKNSLFVYFYVFINEIQYFMITSVFLILYTFRRRLAFIALILTYFCLIGIRTFRFISKERDLRDIFGYDISNYRFLYGISVYLMGALFGMLYNEYNIDQSIKNDGLIDRNYDDVYSFTDTDSQDSLNMRASNFIKSIAKSTRNQNIIFTISLILCVLPMIYDFSILFPKFYENPLYQLNNSEKLYAFLELDICIFLIFTLIWKFVIFQNSLFKRFLERSFWIPLARSYFVIGCLLCPVTFFVVLSLNYPINFTLSFVIFLGISILSILLLISFIVNILLEVPLKVGFKKLFKKIL